MKKDTRLQIRISKEHKEKLKEIANKRGYKNLSEYIISLVIRDISTSEFINKQMIKDFE